MQDLGVAERLNLHRTGVSHAVREADHGVAELGLGRAEQIDQLGAGLAGGVADLFRGGLRDLAQFLASSIGRRAEGDAGQKSGNRDGRGGHAGLRSFHRLGLHWNFSIPGLHCTQLRRNAKRGLPLICNSSAHVSYLFVARTGRLSKLCTVRSS